MSALSRLVRPTVLFQRSPAGRTLCSASVLRHPHGAGVVGDADKNIVRSSYAPTPIPKLGVTQYAFDGFSQYSNRVALIDSVTHRSLTYGQVVDGVHRWGAVVQRWWRPGTPAPTVALLMKNSPDYPLIFFGTTLVGAVATTMNPNYTAEEVSHQLVDSGANLLVVGSDIEGTALKALQLLQERGHVPPQLFVVGPSSHGHSDLRTLLSDPTAPFANHVDVAPESVAVLPYSSGTTGRPKGVCITHQALNTNIEMLLSESFFQPVDPDVPDRILGLLPFYHIYGILGIMLVGLKISSTIVTLPKFKEHTFVQAMKSHKFTTLPLVPPLIKLINENDDITPVELQSCHSIFCGAAPMSKSSAEKLYNKSGTLAKIREGYGMTEILITHSTPLERNKLGFCGQLLPHVQAKVVDINTGTALPPGERGELWINTPTMMAGYHNRPDATKDTIDEDGWLHTGDIAVYDDDGFFSIVDRIKELIKVKALQVSPSELEDVLLKHPAIADAGVVGVPHDSHGEVPRAYIVRSKKASITEAEVSAYMKERLARHKQLLGGIKFVNDLPKNATGKLLRRELVQMAANEIPDLAPPDYHLFLRMKRDFADDLRLDDLRLHDLRLHDLRLDDLRLDDLRLDDLRLDDLRLHDLRLELMRQDNLS
ncbi:AMP-binding enzyme C-terminal domain [Trinorchestia longiramus]|nr:AMP-binding enzyme C-terminal domain [Trinorchestia longiramus]